MTSGYLGDVVVWEPNNIYGAHEIAVRLNPTFYSETNVDPGETKKPPLVRLRLKWRCNITDETQAIDILNYSLTDTYIVDCTDTKNEDAELDKIIKESNSRHTAEFNKKKANTFLKRLIFPQFELIPLREQVKERLRQAGY